MSIDLEPQNDPPPRPAPVGVRHGPATSGHEVVKIFLTCAAAGLAVTCLAGRALDRPELTTWGGPAAVAPLTAEIVLLLAIATLIADLVHTPARQHPPVPTAVARLLAGLGGVLAAAALAETLLGVETPLTERIAWPAGPTAAAGTPVGHPNLTVAAGLLALVFAVVVGVRPRLARLDALAATLVTAIGALGAAGCLLGLSVLSGSAAGVRPSPGEGSVLPGGSVAGLALPTSIMLVCLGAGRLAGLPITLPGRAVWARPQARWVATVMLPAVLVLPLAAAVLGALLPPARPTFSATVGELGIALAVALLADRTWAAARRVAAAEERRERVSELTGAATVVICDGVIVHANRSLPELLGRSGAEHWTDRTLAELLAVTPDLGAPLDPFRSPPAGITMADGGGAGMPAGIAAGGPAPGEAQDIAPGAIGPAAAGSDLEVIRTRADGTQMVLSVRGVPTEWGTRPAWLVVMQDVTERSRERRELTERARRFAAVVECTPDSVIVGDLDGRIIGWNPGATRIYGYAEAEAIGAQLRILTPGRRSAEFEVLLHRLQSGERVGPVETEHLVEDGRRIWVSLSAGPVVVDGQVVGVAMTTRDITARREAQQQHASIVEAMPVGVITVGVDGVIVTANWQMSKLFGYHPDELVGANVDILVPESLRHAHATLRDEFAARPRALQMGTRRNLWGRRADGGRVAVEIGLTPIQLGGAPGVLAVVSDVSALRAEQQEQAGWSTQLRESNRELEQFAYVASHDLEEPLRMVVSYTELLAERYRGSLDERADRYLAQVLDGGLRMQRLLAALVGYSRIGSGPLTLARVPVRQVADDVAEEFAQAYAAVGGSLAIGDLPVVQADEMQLRQVLRNLLANALRFRSLEPPRVSITADLIDDEWVFRVRDNGIGVSRENSGRIFEMFYRAQQAGVAEGSGLGLAVARRMIEAHGGRLWVEPAPDGGSDFRFAMPVSPIGRPVPVEASSGAVLSGGSHSGRIGHGSHSGHRGP